MRTLIAAILLVNTFQCEQPKRIVCNDKIDVCFSDCARICRRTIDKDYQFGACFSRCTEPCRKEYCKKARMVKQVDTEDLKSFACNGHGGSSPSVSIVK